MQEALALGMNLLLAVLLSICGAHLMHAPSKRTSAWLLGRPFGLAIVLTMAYPIVLEQGWTMDFRSILCSLAAYIGGPITALVSFVISSVFQLSLVKRGAVVGVISLFVYGAIGLLLHYYVDKRKMAELKTLIVLGWVLTSFVLVFIFLGAIVRGQAQNISVSNVVSIAFYNIIGVVVIYRLFHSCYQEILRYFVLRTAYENSFTHITALDNAGRVVLLNSSLRQLPQLQQQILEFLRSETGEEASVAFAQGEEHYLLDKVPIVLPNGEKGTIVLLKNITEAKQAHAMVDVFFAHSPDGFVILDDTSRILRCNTAFAQMLGVDAAYLKDKPITNFIHPDDLEPAYKTAAEVLESGQKPIQIECRFIAKDGTIRWLSWVAVYNEQDSVIYAAVRDMTERVQTERALRSQTEKLQEQLSLLELAHDAIIIRTMDNKITFWNHGAEVCYGYTKAQVSGANYHELLRSEYSEPLAEIEKHLLEHGHWAGEATRTKRDGSRLIVSCQWVVQRRHDGLPQAVLEISRDITQRKQEEMAISQLAAIVQQSDDAIISLSADGNVLTLNRGAEKMLGYSAAEMQGSPFAPLLVPECLPQWQDTVNKVRSGQSSGSMEAQLLRANQVVVPVLISISPIRNRMGEPSALSLIIRDITRRKMLDREMVRLDRLNLAAQLAAGIGHEIRNPMTTVRGFLQLFGKKPELQAFASQFELVISELDRANDIISEFLTLARNRPIEFNETQLNDCIELILPLLKADAIIADKEIVVDLGQVPELQLNPKEIRQLILNLVRNGLESMAPGKKLTIKTQLRSGQVVLSVQDEGCGIPPELWDKIGTPFFTTKQNGTGLGLAVCYTIAEQHGAKITFETSNKGTTFYVTFPVH